MLLRRPYFSLLPISVIGSTIRQDRIPELQNNISNDLSIKQPNVIFTTDNSIVIKEADEIILTVKPGQVNPVCDLYYLKILL